MDHHLKRSHAHDEPLISGPAAKRTRHFIEDILEISVQSGSGESELENFIEKLGTTVQHNQKFKTTTFKSKFQIKNLPADPEQMLTHLFKTTIEGAMTESRKNHVEPSHLGCIISSPLLDPHVYIPIRPVTADTTDAILNRFLQIGQSKKQDNTSLWGEPFTMTVTTMDVNGLKSSKTFGSGRKEAAVHHRVNPSSLIKGQIN